MHGPHHVLPADGALAHPLPAFGAGDHVATLQQDAVDDGVHADAAQVVVGGQLSPDAACGREVHFSVTAVKATILAQLLSQDGGE